MLRQPDGGAFLARRVGDENRNFMETAEGYTIIQDDDSGFWFYAVERDGLLEKSNLIVGKDQPDSLPLRKHLRPKKLPTGEDTPRNDVRPAASPALGGGDSPDNLAAVSAPMQPRPGRGVINHLVIPARFTDHTIYVSRDELDKLFNEDGHSADGAFGSVKDYYDDVSAGQLIVESTVPDWVTLPRSESFYGANDGGGYDSNPYQLVRDAVRALDAAGFDFRPFDGDGDGTIDMLTIVHSGLGEEYTANPSNCVWSKALELFPAETVDKVKVKQAAIVPERRYAGILIVRIGVICHEMGHLLGLPDLYDTDGSSEGIGNWGLMGGGSWGGDGYSPERPVHFCCWSKVKLGWIEPTEIDFSSSPVSVPGIEKAGSWGAIRISCEMADGEYLLIENRRKTGYDLRLPGDGLLIWHVDENQPWNIDESHYMVGLLQADGDADLEKGLNRGDAGDPFPGSSSNRFLDNSTSPGTTSYYNGVTHVAIHNISDSTAMMTFEISTLRDVCSENFSAGLPSDWVVVDGGDDGYTWSDQNPGQRSHECWSGEFMIVDSDAAGWQPMDEKLISHEIDCSFSIHTHIKFSHYFRASAAQTGDVDIRVDGGKWHNVARYKYDDDSGTKSIDISSFADGRSRVQVRWCFYNISFGWYWGIDNFAIRGEHAANSPPQLTITSISQREDASGRIEIQFIGTDPENDPVMWAGADCQYASSPFITWQPLKFDTPDPANTAIEPMLFTAAGWSFVAVVNASAWDGPHKVKLRVTDGVTKSPAVISDEFSVDNRPPAIAARTYLEQNPVSGASWMTARATWSDSNPGTTWFQLRLNGGAWGNLSQGSPNGQASQTATLTCVPLDGDDYLTVKSHHIDAFGNRSEESTSADYCVVPLTPAPPSLGNPTPSSLRIVVQPNAADTADLHYAVYCPTEGKYVDWQTGGLVETPSWGSHARWGGSSGIIVAGLRSKTSYAFEVIAANPRNHDSRSQPSQSGFAVTLNTPPSMEVLGQRGAYAGQSIRLDIVSSDADGAPTTIACPSVPPGAALIQNGDGTATLLWPNPSEDLRYEIAFSASDGAEEVVETVPLTFSLAPFEVASVGKRGESGQLTILITWYALPGVVYSIEGSADLLSWESVVGGIFVPEDIGVAGWLTYHDSVGVSPSPSLFYRVGM